MNLNEKKKKLYDMQQERADHLDKADRAYSSGDTKTYDAEMALVKAANPEMDRLLDQIRESEKSFGTEGYPGGLETDGSDRVVKSGISLADTIRKSERYAEAWLKSVQAGLKFGQGRDSEAYKPLYDAEKAMTISGGDTTGEDGGFLVPLDFETTVATLAKDFIDLSTLVNVETVSVNSGWRVVETSADRTALSKVTEMASISPQTQPKFKQVNFSCAKFGDRISVSNELLSDTTGLMNYLAAWWAPKYVLTKNALILELLNKQTFAALSGSTDSAQVQALKTLLNVGLNTAHSRNAVILTNAAGYNIMDGWAETSGKPLLVPDPGAADFTRFKNRPVRYADVTEIPNHSVKVSDTVTKTYNPLYVGDFKRFATLFLRQGLRVKATDIGGGAFETDAVSIRATCRMDCKAVDTSAVKFTGIEVSA